MKIVPNWVILVVTVAVFTIAFGGTYFLGRSAGAKAVRLEVAEQQNVALIDAAKRERKTQEELELERARLRDVSAKLQDALAGKDVVYEEVHTTITKEVEKPVYRDSALPASGVQVLSDAAERFNALRSSKD